MLRVPYDDLYRTLERAMQHLGLQGDRAGLCARLFSDTTRDGVYTHGLNRFPRFAEMVANGCIDVNAEPTRVEVQAHWSVGMAISVLATSTRTPQCSEPSHLPASTDSAE